MSRILAASLATVGCLIGAYLSVSPASAQGPVTDLIGSDLVPEPADTYLICCAPIVTTDPEPLPVPLVDDTLDHTLQSDLLDIVPENPIIDIPPEQPVLPTPPPLQPPETILPPDEEPSGVSSPGDNQVPAPEPAPIDSRADSREPSVVLAQKPPGETRPSHLGRWGRIDDRPVKPDAGMQQPPGRDPSGVAVDIPTALFSPATLLAPFDSAGLFKTTAVRDSILAVIAALPALAALWAWLRRQQRERDRLLVSLADPLHRKPGVFSRHPTPGTAGRRHTDDNS
jgi:hypothetical protein